MASDAPSLPGNHPVPDRLDVNNDLADLGVGFEKTGCLLNLVKPENTRNQPKSILKAWKLCDKLNGVIQVSRLKDRKAAELFLGFRRAPLRVLTASQPAR
jgi:hypothetical protein